MKINYRNRMVALVITMVMVIINCVPTSAEISENDNIIINTIGDYSVLATATDISVYFDFKEIGASLGDRIVLQPVVRDQNQEIMDLSNEDFTITWYRSYSDDENYYNDEIGNGSSFVIDGVKQSDFNTTNNNVGYWCEIKYYNLTRESYFYITEVDNPIDSVELVSPEISIKEYTHGCFYGNRFEYSIIEILNEHPIELQINYKNDATEYLTLSYDDIDYSLYNLYVPNINGKGNYVAYVDIMGHEVEIPIVIIENLAFDKVVSGTVIGLPDHKRENYPLGTQYDARGIEIEFTFESGKKEVVTLDDACPYSGVCSFEDYDVGYSIRSYIEEGVNHISMEILDLEIPITTVIGSDKEVDSYKFMTMPRNVYGEGATVEITYSDGSKEIVLLEEFYGTSGEVGAFENGIIATNVGFCFNFSVVLDNFDMLNIAYGDSAWSVQAGDYVTLDFEGIDKKMLVAVALGQFKDSKFEGVQTTENVDKMLVSSIIYYNYRLTDGFTTSLENAEYFVEKMYDVESLDLTKSSKYNSYDNQVEVYFNRTSSLFDLVFSENLVVCAEEDEYLWYKYTGEDNTTYVKLAKEDNKILYIGDFYPGEVAPSSSATVSTTPSATASATAQPSASATASVAPSATVAPSTSAEPSTAPTVVPSKKPAVKKSIKFTKKSVKIKKGKKATLKVKIIGTKKAKFSVDKKGKKVVKLSKKKAKSVVVTGKKKGKAVITAKAAGKKATCKVTVK